MSFGYTLTIYKEKTPYRILTYPNELCIFWVYKRYILMAMRILAYLRASTIEQDALRAKEALIEFADKHSCSIDQFYIENESGRLFEREVLMRLINDAKHGDILLCEQIDRLTRLSEDDWERLKKKIETQGLIIVSIDLPTSHALLKPINNELDTMSRTVNQHINAMLLDILAVTAAKDYKDRRRRQAQGIATAKKVKGKYLGKRQTQQTIDKCHLANLYIKENKLKQAEACKLAGVSISTWRRFNND